ncbi:MAG: acetylxylan esterase [Thermoanaerobaculia bacterium]
MTSRFLIAALLLDLAAAAMAQVPPAAPAPGFASLSGPFDYERGRPLDVRETAVRDVEGAEVHDITFASPRRGRVTAFLVVPRGRGPFAAVLFQHWGFGDRTEFLAEALLYARAGAVGLLVDAPWARPDSWRSEGEGHITKPEVDRDLYVQTVVDLRRGVDLLLSRPDIDPKRLAYVGHSYGATWGGVLAGVERRVKAFVLMAGLPSVTDFSKQGAAKSDALSDQVTRAFTKKQIARFVEVVSPLDPVRWVGLAAPSAILMQGAREDVWISEKAARQYFAAASLPKEERWYDSGHELNDPRALRDRAEWLRAKIGIATIEWDK